jgi:hypothetical protein
VENNGSYLAPNDCGTLLELQEQGFNPTADVVGATAATPFDSDANEWVASLQNTNGGNAYTFTTETGRVTEAARGAALPAFTNP